MRQSLDHSTLEAAARWYVDLQAAPNCHATRKAHRLWLDADPTHRQAWLRVEKLQHKLGVLPSPVLHSTLRGAAQVRRREMLKLLTLLLATSGGSIVAWQNTPWRSWMAEQRTATGERRTLRLADGGLLEMNTNTALDIRYSDRQREIHLYRGEILVETAPDTLSRPFVVQVPQGTIHALGTRFLVRSMEERATVGVLKDAVEIRPKALSDSLIHLDKGQYLEFFAHHASTIEPLAGNADAWTHGMLIASNWRLDDFIAELTRYRPGYLGCAESVAGLRISGSFQLGDTDVVLDNLAGTLPLKVSRFTRYWVRLESR
ncbi:FecR domain-containing protein [Azomonas macrocytogenes]|uniref:Transmembrane sensor n=1 Tax=Azomonas macrocytogenes TaxID=69962 RepID=A0A839T5I4_AZOMA|nr:transmembrane sensor [Azomonas macrocytogenes]